MSQSVAALVHGFATLRPARPRRRRGPQPGRQPAATRQLLRDALAAARHPGRSACSGATTGSPGATATSAWSRWPSGRDEVAASLDRPRRADRRRAATSPPSPRSPRPRHPAAGADVPLPEPVGRRPCASPWPAARRSASPTPTTSRRWPRPAPSWCRSTRARTPRLPERLHGPRRRRRVPRGLRRRSSRQRARCSPTSAGSVGAGPRDLGRVRRPAVAGDELDGQADGRRRRRPGDDDRPPHARLPRRRRRPWPRPLGRPAPRCGATSSTTRPSSRPASCSTDRPPRRRQRRASERPRCVASLPPPPPRRRGPDVAAEPSCAPALPYVCPTRASVAGGAQVVDLPARPAEGATWPRWPPARGRSEAELDPPGHRAAPRRHRGRAGAALSGRRPCAEPRPTVAGRRRRRPRRSGPGHRRAHARCCATPTGCSSSPPTPAPSAGPRWWCGRWRRPPDPAGAVRHRRRCRRRDCAPSPTSPTPSSPPSTPASWSPSPCSATHAVDRLPRPRRRGAAATAGAHRGRRSPASPRTRRRPPARGKRSARPARRSSSSIGVDDLDRHLAGPATRWSSTRRRPTPPALQAVARRARPRGRPWSPS